MPSGPVTSPRHSRSLPAAHSVKHHQLTRIMHRLCRLANLGYKVCLWEAGLTLDFHQSSPLPKGTPFSDESVWTHGACAEKSRGCAGRSDSLIRRSSAMRKNPPPAIFPLLAPSWQCGSHFDQRRQAKLYSAFPFRFCDCFSLVMT